ncbi:hypothetical protein PAAG_11082 [Paracoccidioides lutzii Pb01]|uniref:rRNA methyltransferase 2, mitochondrial n=1 Tax=Paracoccidioides lutzii (strain ATCC MYA-826 / Pb01) TaxID=502779 RepID=A0A0A2V2Y4_PARBA|nr:hypothetical protein PAAG_11082 [Paracoccidioides lutzii Pb01]KGQ02131.1 hypothetical protein PAAG_11082 [Paracoccidioides lutzii Pb01]
MSGHCLLSLLSVLKRILNTNPNIAVITTYTQLKEKDSTLMSLSKQNNLSARHESLSTRTAQLETEYEKALCQTELIVGSEQNRILHVHFLLADHDRDSLYSELEETKGHLERAEKIGCEAQEQLSQVQNDVDYLRNSLQVRLREIDDLKSNIRELQATSADSAKLLAEKRSMLRELSNLNHEIERLKSQNLSHQSLVSEKLLLQRQLSSLEVELQSEKRALEKVRLKGLKQSEEDNKKSIRLEELTKEIARERREREKIEKDMKAEAVEWTRQRAVFENKLTTLRNRLRGSEDELRQFKDKSNLDGPPLLEDAGTSHRENNQRRKRSASKYEPDITIDTPRAAAHPQKNTRLPTIPGEKSTFSTTPFLNRTSTTAESSDTSKSDADEKPARRLPKRIENDIDMHDPPKHRKSYNQKAAKTTNWRRPTKPQEECAKVVSDDDGAVDQPGQSQADSSILTTHRVAGRKRILLPKKPERTLFDDDDGFEDSNKERRRVPGGFRALGGGQFGLGASGRRLGIPMKLCGVRTLYRAWLPTGENWRVQPNQIFELSIRHSSSKRWQARQAKDRYSREAIVKGLKSRAAFKLLQINDKHKIFKVGQSVVDLGYAPGSWSQVAVELTQPNGRVVGVDIIPAQPPKGVSTIQGNFLSPQVQAYVQEFLRNPNRGRVQRLNHFENTDPDSQSITGYQIEESEGYIDRERSASSHITQVGGDAEDVSDTAMGDKTVDVVLSDMSAPWDQTTGFWKKSLSDPYHRMMNTSGMSFRDHAGSMDLCRAALEFSFNVLKTGGHFVCKFYQGAEDKALERQLKELFQTVHREKPESSRSESKEAYFIGLRRKHNAVRDAVLPP